MKKACPVEKHAVKRISQCCEHLFHEKAESTFLPKVLLSEDIKMFA